MSSNKLASTAARLARYPVIVTARSQPSPRSGLARQICKRHVSTSYYPSAPASGSPLPKPPKQGVKVGHVFAALALLGIGATSYGLYSFYSSFSAFPAPVRSHLRTALRASNDGDYERSSSAFSSALDLAVSLANDGQLGKDDADALIMCTGIAARWGGMWEGVAGQRDKAVEVYRKGYELVMRYMSQHRESKDDGAKEKVVLRGASLAMRIGDLYVDARQDHRAEPYYVWSIEELMRLSLTDAQKAAVKEQMDTGAPSTTGATQSGEDELGVPGWIRGAELVAGFERLGELYMRQRKVELAQPLLQQAVVALFPPPNKDPSKRKPPPPIQNRCHAATLMNNLSSSYVLDASPSAEAIDNASRWARQALTVANACRKEAEKKRGSVTSTPSTAEMLQREDRECELVAVVGAYNLGKLAELCKDARSAKKWFEKSKAHATKLGIREGVQQATEALRRLESSAPTDSE